jgi:glyoxylase-like metal-dependent hydrolase (beta-lactamase superfamily II)
LILARAADQQAWKDIQMSPMQAIGAENWYRVTCCSDNVTLIDEPHIKPFYRCNIWHLRGRDRDLLFDSGLGTFSLRRHIGLLRERPIVCVASHTHFDHIGSHHEFVDRRVHGAEADILARPDRDRTLAAKYADEQMFNCLPEGWNSATYNIPPAPATALLKDGDVLDLGDRAFDVIHTPGHSPGGIALWEKKTGILLSGDIVYDGPLILDAYHSDIRDYDASMERLDRLPVNVVHGGHFPSFGRERFKAVIQEYREGRRKGGCHLAS